MAISHVPTVTTIGRSTVPRLDAAQWLTRVRSTQTRFRRENNRMRRRPCPIISRELSERSNRDRTRQVRRDRTHHLRPVLHHLPYVNATPAPLRQRAIVMTGHCTSASSLASGHSQWPLFAFVSSPTPNWSVSTPTSFSFVNVPTPPSVHHHMQVC
jgi:hypothetical protein